MRVTLEDGAEGDFIHLNNSKIPWMDGPRLEVGDSILFRLDSEEPFPTRLALEAKGLKRVWEPDHSDLPEGWRAGECRPFDKEGEEGDFFYCTSDGTVLQKGETEWVVLLQTRGNLLAA